MATPGSGSRSKYSQEGLKGLNPGFLILNHPWPDAPEWTIQGTNNEHVDKVQEV
jgi:hypothetical protein